MGSFIIKFTHLLISLLSIMVVVTSQPLGFELIIETEGGSVILDTKEDYFGNIIFCGTENVYTTINPLKFKSFVIKVNKDGEYQFHSFDYTGDTITRLYSIEILPDSNYLLFGTIGTPDSLILQKMTKYIWVVKMSSQLEVIWEKRYKLPDIYWNPGYKTWLSNGTEIYAAGRCNWFDNLSPKPNIFFAKFNIDGDTLQTRYPFINNPNYYPIGAFTSGKAMGRNFGQDGMIQSGHGFIIGSGKGVVEIDSDLNYTFTPFSGTGSTYAVNEPVSLKRLSGHTYLISSSYSVTSDKFLNVARVNAGHQFINKVLFGAQDTVDYPIPLRSLDFTDPNEVIVVGRANAFPYSNKNMFVTVALTDTVPNLKGLKFFGGDANYFGMDVTATSDGGFIIGGSFFDWQNSGSDEVNVWIKKIFPDDIITHSENTIDPNDRDVILYPNPARDFLTIHCYRKNLVFRLITTDGKVLVDEKITNFPTQNIRTQHLKRGSYPYQIIDVKYSALVDSGILILQ